MFIKIRFNKQGELTHLKGERTQGERKCLHQARKVKEDIQKMSKG
jgi:hypothetical protein